MDPRCRLCLTILPRGSFVNFTRRGRIVGRQCKSTFGCFDRVIAQRGALLKAGNAMRNGFEVLSKRTTYIHPQDPLDFITLRNDWDAAKTATGLR